MGENSCDLESQREMFALAAAGVLTSLVLINLQKLDSLHLMCMCGNFTDSAVSLSCGATVLKQLDHQKSLIVAQDQFPVDNGYLLMYVVTCVHTEVVTS